MLGKIQQVTHCPVITGPEWSPFKSIWDAGVPNCHLGLAIGYFYRNVGSVQYIRLMIIQAFVTFSVTYITAEGSLSFSEEMRPESLFPSLINATSG